MGMEGELKTNRGRQDRGITSLQNKMKQKKAVYFWLLMQPRWEK